jgi:hypothetical protein
MWTANGKVASLATKQGELAMPRDYSVIFDDLSYPALETIRQRLRLSGEQFFDSPYKTLTENLFCAADAIVALAGSPATAARDAIEKIFGRPVTVCPPCLQGTPVTFPRRPGNDGDNRRILHVAHNTRYITTPAYQRYAMLRPGMTVRAYLTRVGDERGRRDLREWTREGSVRLS